MLGGLYGDLPAAKNANEASASAEKAPRPEGWSSGVKAMIPPPRAKNPLISPPPSVLKAQGSLLAKPKPSPRTSDSSSVRDRASSDVIVSTPNYVGASLKAELEDEYDPGRPNDYEDYCRERIRLKREKEVLEHRDRQRKELERERQEREETQRSRPTGFDQRSSALNVSGEEAFLRRGKMGGQPPSPPRSEAEASPSLQDSNNGGLTAAQRMMQKMGWREGSGLGRTEQGMTTPLIAKKTEGRSGVVVQGSETSDNSLLPDAKRPKLAPVQQAPSNPTRILLLRNMVGPGEVDDDLEDEVAEECAGKYGAVRMVKIFEVTEPNWPAHETVRIFVEFEREESSMKGMIDLDGRFFGGRVVHASFFDLERFENNMLAPLPGEVQL